MPAQSVHWHSYAVYEMRSTFNEHARSQTRLDLCRCYIFVIHSVNKRTASMIKDVIFRMTFTVVSQFSEQLQDWPGLKKHSHKCLVKHNSSMTTSIFMRRATLTINKFSPY